MNNREEKNDKNKIGMSYEEVKIGKTWQLWEKGFRSECDGDKKVIKISYCFDFKL